MMRRLSQRFFNPRPAPPAPDGAEAQEEIRDGAASPAEMRQQYGVAYSRDEQGDPVDYTGAGAYSDSQHHGGGGTLSSHGHQPQYSSQGHQDSNQSHSHSHGVESEIMAGSGEDYDHRAEMAQGYSHDDVGAAEMGEKSMLGHGTQNVTGDLERLRRAQQQARERRISLSNGMARNRLPTLAEVLARRTLPPVDLYCFYLFMQREGSEDALDFWLDVQQHENLCRAYFKDLRRSGRSVAEDWPGYYREARTRGSIFSPVTGIDPEDGEEERMMQTEDRSESMMGGYGRASDGEWHLPAPGQPRFPGDPDFTSHRGSQFTTSDRAERKTALFKRGTVTPTVLPRTTAITRTDLVASAERIYARYLLPGSEKEIYLPQQLRINSFPLSSSTLPDPEDEHQQAALARVPDMFHAQKEYVFRTMEVDVFPRFLRARAFGNLTPISALVRLTLGLLALWAGLATGFAFIFLDVYRRKRLWVILPFSIAILLIVSHQYELDPLLALLQQSETTPFHLITVRERYVRKLLLQRAAGVLFLVTLITAALTVLFVFVPGHRL